MNAWTASTDSHCCPHSNGSECVHTVHSNSHKIPCSFHKHTQPYSLISIFWYVSVISAWLYPGDHSHLLQLRNDVMGSGILWEQKGGCGNGASSGFPCEGSVKRESPCFLSARGWSALGLLRISSGFRPSCSSDVKWRGGNMIKSSHRVTLKQSSLEKRLAKPQKAVIKKTYTSYFPILKLWTISSGREGCFSAGNGKNSHDS